MAITQHNAPKDDNTAGARHSHGEWTKDTGISKSYARNSNTQHGDRKEVKR